MSTIPLGQLLGKVTAADDAGTLLGSVEAGATTHTLLGTVDATAYASYSGAPHHYVRVKIDGSWVPESELVGPVEHDQDIDSPIDQASFGLRGEAWSIWATQRSWTRSTVEIRAWRGAPTAMVEEVVFLGRVHSCTQEDDHGPVLRVTCGNESALAGETVTADTDLCYELAPFSGKTRGEILADALAVVGLNIDTPAGELYDGAVQVNNQRVFAWATAFAEPAGWKIRRRSDGTLEAWTPQRKVAPQPPDEVWAGDWFRQKSTPPSPVASRYIVRFSTTVSVDAAGRQTKTNVTEIEAPYSPAIATQQQDTSGTITSTGFSAAPATTRPVYRLIDTQVTEGIKPIQQRTEEWGWYNPLASYLWWDGVGGSGPEGMAYRAVYLDSGGEFVRYIQEKWQVKSVRLTSWTYDENGDLNAQQVDSYRWNRRTSGYKTAGAAGPSINPSYVYGDVQSYSAAYEVFELAERQVIVPDYDTATGAKVKTVQDTYQFYSPRTRADGTSASRYVLWNGEAQTNIVANFILVQTDIKVEPAPEGLVTGAAEISYGYSAPIRWGGTYDWGPFQSDQEAEIFTLLPDRGRQTQYNIEGERQVTEVDYTTAGRRERTVLGGLPVPIYRASDWTRATLTPGEVIVDDDTVEAWFGFRREVIEHPWVQSGTEAKRVLADRRARDLAHTLEIERPLTLADLGDTLKVIDPPTRLRADLMVTARRRRWDLARGEATATYTLELPL